MLQPHQRDSSADLPNEPSIYIYALDVDQLPLLRTAVDTVTEIMSGHNLYQEQGRVCQDKCRAGDGCMGCGILQARLVLALLHRVATKVYVHMEPREFFGLAKALMIAYCGEGIYPRDLDAYGVSPWDVIQTLADQAIATYYTDDALVGLNYS